MTSDRLRGPPATAAIPWPLETSSSRPVLRHPQLGEYVCDEWCGEDWALWGHARQTSDGKRLFVRGRSLHPTDEQVRLWNEIDFRLPELTRAALESVGPPPVKPLPRAFARDDLALREVRLETNDGTVELWFDTPLGDDLDAWPCVTFRDWKVTGSWWSP